MLLTVQSVIVILSRETTLREPLLGSGVPGMYTAANSCPLSALKVPVTSPSVLTSGLGQSSSAT